MTNTAKKKLTPAEIDDFAYELLKYCLKWGMTDMSVFANGNRYCLYNFQQGQKALFRDIEIYVSQEDPKVYMNAEYVNPDHILSMSFDGGLLDMLSFGLYENDLEELTEEGRRQLRILDPSLTEDRLSRRPREEAEPILDVLEFESYQEYLDLKDVLEDDEDEYEDECEDEDQQSEDALFATTDSMEIRFTAP